MPRPSKTRVGTETDKRKAEIFNRIDDLISLQHWNEAIEYLQYLYRNTPSLHTQVLSKFALLYYEMNNPAQSLTYLYQLIPTNNFIINRMFIKNLLLLGEKRKALLYLARAPVTPNEKKKLYRLIFPDKKSQGISLDNNLILLRCSKCTRFLFFINNRYRCLFCSKKAIKLEYY